MAAVVPANGTATLTVTNPTTADLRSGQCHQGGDGCDGWCHCRGDLPHRRRLRGGRVFTFDLARRDTVSTPDVPVGTVMHGQRGSPTGGLVDGSYAWVQPPPAAQNVTITSSGQVVAVTVTNTVVRVLGQLTITKAPIATPGVVDSARTFAIGYSCVYGNDPAIDGVVNLLAWWVGTVGPFLLNSKCTVTEDPATLTAPPSATDPSWVWLPVTYATDPAGVVTSSTTPVSVTVTNTIQQLTGSFNVTKTVTGGQGRRLHPRRRVRLRGHVRHPPAGAVPFTLADGESSARGAGPSARPARSRSWRRDRRPLRRSAGTREFTVNGVPAGLGARVTFVIPPGGDAGAGQRDEPDHAPARFDHRREAGHGPDRRPRPGRTAVLGHARLRPRAGLRLERARRRQRHPERHSRRVVLHGDRVGAAGGLVDASYAWNPPTYVPANATVTVVLDTPSTITVINEIVRVTEPVHLVKTVSGTQGVIDPAHTYPIQWSCIYGAVVVASGSVSIPADPGGVTVARDVPLTSVCSATRAISAHHRTIRRTDGWRRSSRPRPSRPLGRTRSRWPTR